jgi:hypothetical protein
VLSSGKSVADGAQSRWASRPDDGLADRRPVGTDLVRRDEGETCGGDGYAMLVAQLVKLIRFLVRQYVRNQRQAQKLLGHGG